MPVSRRTSGILAAIGSARLATEECNLAMEPECCHDLGRASDFCRSAIRGDPQWVSGAGAAGSVIVAVSAISGERGGTRTGKTLRYQVLGG